MSERLNSTLGRIMDEKAHNLPSGSTIVANLNGHRSASSTSVSFSGIDTHA